MPAPIFGIARIFSSASKRTLPIRDTLRYLNPGIAKLYLFKSMATLPAKLDAISAVDIDSGRFKYVLIRVDMQDEAETKHEYSKIIVRGYNWASFHADIYDKVQEELEAAGFDTECLGGGRILHDPSKRSIQVYGYSQGFGLADHAVTTGILKTHYPDYESITWTNEEMHHVRLISGTMDAILMVVVLLVATQPTTASLSCRAEDGQPVDWFVLYKLPSGNSGESSDGRAYLYRTSSSSAKDGSKWISSSQTIDSLTSLPGRTLEPIYSSPKEHLVSEEDDKRLLLMYNDEFPNGTSSETTAHAKGIVAFDGQSGFWLVHSVPRFPPDPDGGPQGTKGNYSYPTTGLRYGQTMLCVSLPLHQADLIGKQLLYYHPFVYHWTVSSASKEWIQMLPNLAAVARGAHITQPPWSRSIQLLTSDQLAITSFAKSRQFGLDLYGDWMAAALQSSLYVETWTNGQGHPMPSFCMNRTFTVQNIKQVHLSDRQAFPSHSDHSKWAISSRQEEPWVCIADINRMDSQRHRGGGSLCFRQPELWLGFDQAVNQLEACPLSSAFASSAKWKLKNIKKKKKQMMKMMMQQDLLV